MATILIVDASERDRDRLQGKLEGHGFAVRTGADADEARLIAADVAIALIVLDESSSGAMGIDALRALGRDPTTAGVPIVMTASRARAADKVRALWQGARDYLAKPVDERRLVKLVSALSEQDPGVHPRAVSNGP